MRTSSGVERDRSTPTIVWLGPIGATSKEVGRCSQYVDGNHLLISGDALFRDAQTISEASERVEAKIRAFTDSPVTLVGTSLSGIVAQQVIANRRVSVASVLLISSWLHTDAHQYALLDFLVSSARNVPRDVFVRGFLALTCTPKLFAMAPVAALVMKSLERTPPFSLLENSEVLAELRTHDSRNDIAGAKYPILLVSGEHDFLSARHTLAARDRYSFVDTLIIEGASHSLMIEQPREVAKALGNLLTRIATGCMC